MASSRTWVTRSQAHLFLRMLSSKTYSHQLQLSLYGVRHSRWEAGNPGDRTWSCGSVVAAVDADSSSLSIPAVRAHERVRLDASCELARPLSASWTQSKSCPAKRQE